MKFPPVKMDYYPMIGGLDLVTPAIEISPGKLFDAQNYEPIVSGGYGRINGFERYAGQPEPSAAPYWSMTVNPNTAFGVPPLAFGQVITGVTSGATATVLGLYGNLLVMCSLTGVFVVAESFTSGGYTKGTVSTPAYINNASSASDNADYAFLTSNALRAGILPPVGDGPIRGVQVYRDVLYCFKDNVGSTAGLMYKATSSGWALVAFGKEIQFNNGANPIVAGNTITDGTSGATALVVKVLVRTGSFGFAAAGTLIVSTVVGTWTSGHNIKVGATVCAVATSGVTNITRLPGGRVECVNANFTGSTDTKKMYGADGVNLAFEFDGTNYIPIRTGMAVDTPLHIVAHKASLFLSFMASVQFSGIGNPYAWTTILGAGEISTGSNVTGFLVQTGNQTGASMAIFTTEQMFILYGSTSADYKLVPSVWDLGFLPYTGQLVSNNAFGLTSMGIQSVVTTLNYGDFNFNSISHLIQPLISTKQGLQLCSTTLHKKSQYRVYFSDGTGFAVGFTGDTVNGILPLYYGGVIPNCMCTATLSNGTEVTYFGATNGTVYQDSIGTSFDGNPIEAWLRPAFNNVKSPWVRKRYRRAVFEVFPSGFSSVNIGYDIGYANPDVLPPLQVSSNNLYAGGYWDQFTWDAFTWDSKVIDQVNVSLDGTDTNISFLFYSNRAQDSSHTVQGVTLMFTIRRQER